MFAHLKIDKIKNESGEKWANQIARLARPVLKYTWEMIIAPVELAQRAFYKPNTHKETFVVEDLHAKSKDALNRTYIEECTRKLHTKTANGKFDPRRTYENLDICQSGTFKIPGMETEEAPTPELTLIDDIPQPNIIPIVSMSDSQIMRARQMPSMTESQVMRARRSLVVRPLAGELASGAYASESGTYSTLPAQWHNQAQSVKQCGFTQSGVYQLIEPDINPHGLQQFIKQEEEEKTA
jgi:hypothetical protein